MLAASRRQSPLGTATTTPRYEDQIPDRTQWSNFREKTDGSLHPRWACDLRWLGQRHTTRCSKRHRRQRWSDKGRNLRVHQRRSRMALHAWGSSDHLQAGAPGRQGLGMALRGSALRLVASSQSPLARRVAPNGGRAQARPINVSACGRPIAKRFLNDGVASCWPVWLLSRNLARYAAVLAGCWQRCCCVASGVVGKRSSAQSAA